MTRTSPKAAGKTNRSATFAVIVRTQSAMAKNSRKCDASATWEMLSRHTKIGIESARNAA